MEDLDIPLKIEQKILLHDPSRKAGLMDGYSGLCLFYHQLYKQFRSPEYQEKYIFCLNKIYDSLEADVYGFDFKTGLAGILWLFDYLKNEECHDLDHDFREQTENLLEKAYKNALHDNNWEYMRGAAGCLHVLTNLTCYDAMLDYLESALSGKKELYSPYYRDNTNLGVPFGILSLLYFLDKMRVTDSIQNRAEHLTDLLLSLIFDNELYSSDGSIYFPALSGETFKPRLSWAYGELIIAYQLYLLAEKQNNDILLKKAVKIAEDSTKRDFADTFIFDSCLQHGAAGNYLLYKLLYDKTGLELFNESSKSWKSITLRILEKFNYHFYERYLHKIYKNDSLLEGLAGVGLVFLKPDKSWLSAFLLD